MANDLKGQKIRKGDFLVYVRYATESDCIMLFRSEGPYRKMSSDMKSRVSWRPNDKDQRHMSLLRTLKYGLIDEKDVVKNWVGPEESYGGIWELLKIPKHLCEPEIKEADIIAFVHLAGYTYQGAPYDN